MLHIRKCANGEMLCCNPQKYWETYNVLADGRCYLIMNVSQNRTSPIRSMLFTIICCTLRTKLLQMPTWLHEGANIGLIAVVTAGRASIPRRAFQRVAISRELV